MSKEIVLRVQDSDPSHVGRNIITLDYENKQQLGLTSGDIVEIEGTKKTAAIVWPARSDDEGKKLIRMDNFIRHNAGISLGDVVKVRAADLKEGKEIVLAPIEEVRVIASGYNRILKKTFLGRPLNKGYLVWVSVFGSGFIYKVIATKPVGIVRVSELTDFTLKEQPVKEAASAFGAIAYEDIGGLREQITKVREMIELPMRHPELFRKLGIVPPKGILLFGPPGTGKTLLAKAVANETNAHFISINGPEILSKFVGEAEQKLRHIFKEANENAPSIIFIDEIDAITPKRDEVVGEVERRIVAQLLALMDGLEARGNVIVIAATNRVNSIDEALRRPGRFDREIEFPIPDAKGRKDVLLIHTRGMPLAKDMKEKEGKDKNGSKSGLDHFARITHGFVGADLEALTKEAAMKALSRYINGPNDSKTPQINLEDETISEEVLESLEVTRADFDQALKEVQPSALREITVRIPNVKWDDVGGLDSVKKELKQAVEWPLKKPQVFEEMGIKPPKGILLYGPSGCGKTLLAKAVANESEANFMSVKGPELLNMFVGESEKAIRKIFKKARQVAPVIIFFDELDSIAGSRGNHFDSGVSNRVLDQLLTELDGLEVLQNVLFIAATNRPDLIDQSLLRPGRIDKLIYIGPPDAAGREKILRVHTANVPLAKDVSLKELAEKTEGFSGADLEGLVREATLLAIEENNLNKSNVSLKHFEKILLKLNPTVSEQTENAYGDFKKHYRDFKPSYIA